MFKTNSGGSPFYTDIVGAEKFAETKSGGIPGIKTNDKTGEIVINLTKPRGTFTNELALMFVAPVPPDTPDEDLSANPPPGTGPYMITKSQPGRGWEYERNPYWAKDNAKAMPESPSGHVDKTRSTVIRNPRPRSTTSNRASYDWMQNPPPADRYAEVKEQIRRHPVPDRADDQHLLLLDEHDQRRRSTTSRCARRSTTRSTPRRWNGSTPAQLDATQQILPPGMPATRNSTSTRTTWPKRRS